MVSLHENVLPYFISPVRLDNQSYIYFPLSIHSRDALRGDQSKLSKT